ncbi:MAG: O-antigen ligase domain-containing protein [Proteobacteria bacterium]|nr:MAG: O-antigen ligase domain-containing protein [Pseudomonadota bacterium]
MSMQVSKLTFFDKAFAVMLVVVMTQLYRVIGLVLGMASIAILTGIITALCACYLVVKGKVLYKPIHHYGLLVFATIWPVATSVYADVFDYRAVLMQFHYLLLILSAGVLFSRAPLVAHKLAIASLGISVLAMVVSVRWPAAFASMAAIASARFDYLGRGSGLFLQPNLLAYNLVLLTLLCGRFTGKQEIEKIFAVSLILIAALFFTGSRGGLIAGLVLVLSWVTLSRQMYNRRFILLLVVCMVLLLISLGYIGMFLAEGTLDFSVYINRVMTLLTSDVVYEGSVQYRLAFQMRFLEVIGQNPVFGQGIGSVEYMLQSGELYGAAHNQILDLLLQYGVVGLVIALACGARIAQTVNTQPGSLRGIAILATLLLAMLGTNMLFDMQNFYILLAGLLARVPSPIGLASPHTAAMPRAMGLGIMEHR